MKIAAVILAVLVVVAILVKLTDISNQPTPRLNERGTSASTGPSDHDKIATMSDIERNCLGMYLKYDRVKISDLTMTQLQGIHSCQSLGLYHDLH
jgi:hypothetical protein